MCIRSKTPVTDIVCVSRGGLTHRELYCCSWWRWSSFKHHPPCTLLHKCFFLEFHALTTILMKHCKEFGGGLSVYGEAANDWTHQKHDKRPKLLLTCQSSWATLVCPVLTTNSMIFCFLFHVKCFAEKWLTCLIKWGEADVSLWMTAE